jgi:hypothetical protein
MRKPQHMKKVSNLIVSFFTKLYNLIVSFFKGLYNATASLFKGCWSINASLWGGVFNVIGKISLTLAKTAATVLIIGAVYLGMGVYFPIPLETKTVLPAPQGWVSTTWTKAMLSGYTVHQEGMIKVARSRWSNKVYIQVPLVGWVRV